MPPAKEAVATSSMRKIIWRERGLFHHHFQGSLLSIFADPCFYHIHTGSKRGDIVLRVFIAFHFEARPALHIVENGPNMPRIQGWVVIRHIKPYLPPRRVGHRHYQLRPLRRRVGVKPAQAVELEDEVIVLKL